MVILTVAFFLPALAVIVTLPFFLAFTRPFLLTVAIFLLLVLHLTLSVLFLGVTVAFNVFFAPFFFAFDLHLGCRRSYADSDCLGLAAC